VICGNPAQIPKPFERGRESSQGVIGPFKRVRRPQGSRGLSLNPSQTSKELNPSSGAQLMKKQGPIERGAPTLNSERIFGCKGPS